MKILIDINLSPDWVVVFNVMVGKQYIGQVLVIHKQMILL